MRRASWWQAPWRRPDPARAAAARMYDRVLAQARHPNFYARLGVPDDWNGRFDCLALHMFLTLDRLQAAGAEGREVAQALVDIMFDDLDRSVREAGIGDLSVGRQVKAMAAGFNGRNSAYQAALGPDGEGLEAVLQRNLFGQKGSAAPGAAAAAAYVRAARAALAAARLSAILDGHLPFPPVVEGG